MKKIKLDNKYKEKKIKLDELTALSNEEQFSLVEKTLNEMYEDKVKVSKGYVLKTIKLTVSKQDDYLFLANNLVIEKNSRELIFNFQKKGKKAPVFILLIVTLLVGLFSATYSGLLFLELSNLNQDIDGDGVADVNIDTNEDRIAELNIDISGNQKPEMNIDYKGNRTPMFGLDKDGDGKPDFNLVNDATDENSKCEVNCDSNGDGWPDYNYDVDGDGKADFDIDSDGDGIVDTSIDLNGDLVCDVMCDDDNDGVCDRNCIEYEGDDNKPSGPSDVTGNPDSDITTANLSVVYEDFGELVVEGLLPDDHEGVIYPEKRFTVTNNSSVELIYKLTFIVDSNTFLSNNFQYKIDSDNGGHTNDFVTAPWEETIINSYVSIPANTTQSYVITFKLHGIGEEQNYDQGKKFIGRIRVGE